MAVKYQVANLDNIASITDWLKTTKNIIQKRKKVGEMFRALALKGATIASMIPSTKAKWNKLLNPKTFLESNSRVKKDIITRLKGANLIGDTGKVTLNQWSQYFTKLIDTNIESVRFMRLIVGPVGSGKTYVIKSILNPKQWFGVWVNPDDLNSKAKLQKIFSGTTSNAVSIASHTKKGVDRRNRIFIIDDAETVKLAINANYIIDQISTTKHHSTLAKIFKRQQVMTPVIFICCDDRYHLVSKLQRWSPSPVIRWREPGYEDLKLYAIKVHGIKPMYAGRYATRAHGDFRSVNFGVLLSAGVRDVAEVPEDVFQLIINKGAQSRNITEAGYNSRKLATIVEASYLNYIEGVDNVSKMACLLSNYDLLTPYTECRDDVERYEFVVSKGFGEVLGDNRVVYDQEVQNGVMYKHWQMMSRFRHGVKKNRGNYIYG